MSTQFSRALNRELFAWQNEGRRLLFQVSLKVAFTFTSVDDGTSQTVEACGEALDVSTPRLGAMVLQHQGYHQRAQT
jgi:hypothetical protein